MSLVNLKECPVGLFFLNEQLCLKTEYGNNKGGVDCYIVDSGEYLSCNGRTQTEKGCKSIMVTPVKVPYVEELEDENTYDWITCLKRGDILVCKTPGEPLNEFSIIAVVLSNNRNREQVIIEKHLKFGKLYSDINVFPYGTINKYYEILEDEKLKERFISNISESKLF